MLGRMDQPYLHSPRVALFAVFTEEEICKKTLASALFPGWSSSRQNQRSNPNKKSTERYDTLPELLQHFTFDALRDLDWMLLWKKFVVNKDGFVNLK